MVFSSETVSKTTKTEKAKLNNHVSQGDHVGIRKADALIHKTKGERK